MIDSSTDFYKHVDNFAKYANVGWRCVSGKEELLSKVFVTISIPTYHRPETLKDAIDSALKQKEYDDYCILVIDNDPTDNSTTDQLIKTYHSDKLLYFKNDENIGMFGNQNRCFEIPKSKYVLLLHDDDIILPFYLKTCCDILEAKKYEIDGLQPAKIKWFEKDMSLENLIIPKNKQKNIKRWIDLDNYWCSKTGSQTGGLYKREAVLAVGGYNEDYYPSADFCLGIQLMGKFKIYTFSEVLTVYRVGKNATLKQETLAGFVNDCYYIFRFLLRKMDICGLYSNFILSYLAYSQYEGLKEMYNKDFVFDLRKLGIKYRYPKLLVAPAKFYVSLKLFFIKAVRFKYINNTIDL